MKTVVVANPHASNGRVGRKWADYARRLETAFGPVDFLQTAARSEASILVRRAIRAGAQRIVVVGGDGTVNEAVNGFFENDHAIGAEVCLAVWPVGTGCDFARSIGLTGASFEYALDGAEERRIDLGKASFVDQAGGLASRYFVNISSFGSSGVIVDKVNATSKLLGAGASYFIGALRGLVAYRNQAVRLRIDTTLEVEMVINTVVAANGRYFGGGMMMAPHAVLDDGALDIVVIGDIGVTAFLRDAPRLCQGLHLGQAYVRSFRAKQVEVQPLGKVPVLLELDGEQVGRLPVRYEIVPRALRLLLPRLNANDGRK